MMYILNSSDESFSKNKKIWHPMPLSNIFWALPSLLVVHSLVPFLACDVVVHVGIGLRVAPLVEYTKGRMIKKIFMTVDV